MAGNGGIVAFYAISPSIYPTAARGTGVGWMVGFGRTWGILAPIVAGYLLAAGLTAKSLYMIFGLLFGARGPMRLDAAPHLRWRVGRHDGGHPGG